MTLADSIFAYLGAAAGATALLGTGSDINLWPTLIGQRQGTRIILPACMFEVYRDQPAQSMGNTVASVSEASVRFEAHADTPAGVTAVLLAVYDALKTFSGVMGGGVTVQTVLCEERAGRPDFDSNLSRFIGEAEYTFFYNL